MSQFSRKQFIVAGTSAVLAVAVTTLLRAHPAAAQNPSPGSAPVSIVSPIPLPVTGSTTISGTVAATQSGTWNVNVRNIDEPGRVLMCPTRSLEKQRSAVSLPLLAHCQDLPQSRAAND
jgi:hypothetical protein